MNLFSLFMTLFLTQSSANEIWNKYQISGIAQGTTYHITYYAPENRLSQFQIDSIFSRIDESLSNYLDHSLITQFNKSTKGIAVDAHFRNVVKRSLEINKDTNGLFDITVLPLVEAWGFTKKGIIPSEPDAATLKKIKENIGYSLLKIDGNRVIKKKTGVKIDVNGIAQGYSVDVISNFFLDHKINNFIVEIGGEIRVSGRRQPSKERMIVGIQSPESNTVLPQSIQKIISLDKGAITTSGNYEKYYKSKGRKISHLMNPVTGFPVFNELLSVTVYAKDAITADGYDNALMALGLKKAMILVKKNKDIEAYFIYKDKNGKVKDTATTNFYKLMK